jgi:AcrR family transcriptional regulator
MARTVDPQVHSVKRAAFVDAAQQLIRSKGYDAISIQDILDAVGASKGAFYHYFGSKEDLLEAVVVRIGESVLAVMAPAADDPDLPAIARLQAVFDAGSRWKSDRRDLMVAVLRAWYSDRNAIVRERVTRETTARVAPILARVLRQGMAEGVFSVTAPDQTAMILVALLSGSGDATGRLFLDRLDGRISIEEVRRAVAAFDQAVERILGIPAGSFRLMDETTLQFWFA